MLGDWISEEVGMTFRGVAEGALIWDISILGCRLIPVPDVLPLSLLEWADSADTVADLDCLDVEAVLDPNWVDVNNIEPKPAPDWFNLGICGIQAAFELDSRRVVGAGAVLDIGWLLPEGVGLLPESEGIIYSISMLREWGWKAVSEQNSWKSVRPQLMGSHLQLQKVPQQGVKKSW